MSSRCEVLRGLCEKLPVTTRLLKDKSAVIAPVNTSVSMSSRTAQLARLRESNIDGPRDPGDDRSGRRVVRALSGSISIYYLYTSITLATISLAISCRVSISILRIHETQRASRLHANNQ